LVGWTICRAWWDRCSAGEVGGTDMLMLREVIGDQLRRSRADQGRTLRDISRAANVSLGYLSEVERGQKEASSELLNAICGALELPLSDLLLAAGLNAAVDELVSEAQAMTESEVARV